MLFSEYYKIPDAKSKTWFDPIMDFDTRLFVDPFLIYKSQDRLFKKAHKKVVDFFQQAFNLSALCINEEDSRYIKLLNMLCFPEVDELCLGYTSSGTKGFGSGKVFAKKIAEAISLSISLGIANPNHFEAIGLFQEGMGCDRISDAVSGLLIDDFIEYTQSECLSYPNITMEEVQIRSYDHNYMRWCKKIVFLPRNPFKDRPVILIPKSFLNTLPTINPGDLIDYLWYNLGETLRNDFNYDIKGKLRKNHILQIAKYHPDIIKQYLKDIENKKPSSYDLKKDSLGIYNWDSAAREFTKNHLLALTIPKSTTTFSKAIKDMIDKFKLFTESNSGYRLLWDDKYITPRDENAVQLLFLGIVREYCHAWNIDISKEVNLGRGPVDFKFSSGYEDRALIEVKLAKNAKFWNGLEKQLPDYMKAEEIETGFFVVICYTDKDLKKVSDIQAITSRVQLQLGFQITTIIIDATPNKPSASKL